MAGCPYMLQIILMCATPRHHKGQLMMTKCKEIGQLFIAEHVKLHLPHYSHFL